MENYNDDYGDNDEKYDYGGNGNNESNDKNDIYHIYQIYHIQGVFLTGTPLKS